MRHFGRLLTLVCLGIALGHAAAQAGLAPENVAIVVNADSWASLTVANAFIAGRGIPPANVIYLSDVPGYEHIGVEEFREKLLKPVLQTIEERGLKPQIDCIAWSSDFPYGIDVQADINAAKLKLPQVFTPVASINGLTYLYELVLAKDPRYLELASNWYYRRPLRADGKDPRPPQSITEAELAKFREAMKLLGDKKWAEASPVLAELAKAHPNEAQLQYNLACCLSQEAKLDEAMTALAAAVKAGWFDRRHTEKDDDLKPLREREDFKALLTQMKPPLFDVQPAAAFRSSQHWNETGEQVEEGGRRYMLSIVLGITSGRGNSLDDAVRILQDCTGHFSEEVPGTVYFMKNGDVRSRTREWAFESAAVKLKKLGVKAEVVDGVLPQNARVLGAVVGIADFDWAKSGSVITHQAIVEHLTSFGGVMREHSGQTPLTAFLKAGAAGASGTVTEPYAIQAKFPTAFLHVHYATGSSLIEAFYQSVQGPYQLLIVGDPLSQPWKAAGASFTGIENFPVVRGKVKVSPQAEDAKETSDFYLDGRRVFTCPPGESFELDTEPLATGPHDLALRRGTERIAPNLRSELLANFTVRSDKKELTISPLNARLKSLHHVGLEIAADEILRVKLHCAGAQSIELRANGQPLVEIAGESGTVGVPLTGIGGGLVRLDATAKTEKGEFVAWPTLIRVIKAAHPLAGDEKLTEAKLAEGLTMSSEGAEPAIIADLRDGNWLASRKLPAGAKFTLTGVFEESRTTEFGSQFQWTGNCDAEIRVDGHRLHPVGNGLWKYLPVWLAPGRHKLEVRGRLPEDPRAAPRLSLRYGGEGTQSLDGKRFQHVVE